MLERPPAPTKKAGGSRHRPLSRLVRSEADRARYPEHTAIETIVDAAEIGAAGARQQERIGRRCGARAGSAPPDTKNAGDFSPAPISRLALNYLSCL